MYRTMHQTPWSSGIHNVLYVKYIYRTFHIILYGDRPFHSMDADNNNNNIHIIHDINAWQCWFVALASFQLGLYSVVGVSDT